LRLYDHVRCAARTRRNSTRFSPSRSRTTGPRAPEYFDGALDVSPETETAVRRELLGVRASFAPVGDVLELACGPGTWTSDLLAYAETVTALDSSPEMLALARATVSDPRGTFVQADVFDWAPARRYDVVFFGFWLSHVPLERFERFWSLVADCLGPEGRVLFIDDSYRTPDELIEGEQSSTNPAPPDRRHGVPRRQGRPHAGGP